MRVIVCGGGVIGTCLAYFLALRSVEVVVVERHGLACAASGKSGGFLAQDWCDGSPLEAMARRSFDLHGELAERLAAEHGLRWGYRRLGTLNVMASERRDLTRRRGLERPAWLAPGAVVQARIGTAETTAQLDPAAFTQAMMAAAERRGARLVIGQAEDIVRSADGHGVVGLRVDGEVLAGEAVVIAMGPWSRLAGAWIPLPAVYGLKGHSLVFEYCPQASQGSAPDAMFVEYEDPYGKFYGPEVMPRADGTTYVCGLSSEAPLPADPADVEPDPGASHRLRAVTGAFAPELAAADVRAAGACFRPITADGLPLIGPVAGVPGAYVSTGHSVWGMLNGPASGEAMAELIVDGASRGLDLGPFAPDRLPPVALG